MFYFFNDTATTEIYTLSLHDALPILAGFHTEYSGFRWAIYMLSEYANIFIVASVAVTLFWGGWLRPFPNVGWLEPINFVGPFLLFMGSALGCVYLTRKLIQPIQKAVLMAVAAVLGLIGLVFLVPAVNSAVIGMFWFFLKVFLIIYCLIWFRG